jgi:hypothetical protein
MGEVEGIFVKGGLGSFLFGGVGKLCLEVVEEVGVSILNVFCNGVELFQALEHCFNPSVHFGTFDKGKSYGDSPNWGLKARDSLVGHHEEVKLPQKGFCFHLISIKDLRRHASLFQVSSRLDWYKVGWGYFWQSSWSSRATRPSRAYRGSRGSSKCDVEGISNLLGVLCWVSRIRERASVSSFSFCESPCNSLCCYDSLSRYSAMIRCVCEFVYSGGCPSSILLG